MTSTSLSVGVKGISKGFVKAEANDSGLLAGRSSVEIEETENTGDSKSVPDGGGKHAICDLVVVGA